jgi:hypothetical protein
VLSVLYFLLNTVNDQYKLQETTPIRDYFFLKFPFSIHCGWIIAASFVNLSVLLVDVGVSANVQYYVALATLICLIACACFCVSFPARLKYVVPAVLAWAAVSKQLHLSIVANVADAMILI